MKCPLCQDLEEQGTILYCGFHSCVAINLHSLKKGHLMILPKRHIEKFNELTKEESKEIFDFVETFSEIINKAYGNYPIITINPIHGRSQPHIHIHLIPTDKYTRAYISKVDNVPESRELTNEEIKEIRNKITSLL